MAWAGCIEYEPSIANTVSDSLETVSQLVLHRFPRHTHQCLSRRSYCIVFMVVLVVVHEKVVVERRAGGTKQKVGRNGNCSRNDWTTARGNEAV